MSNLSECYTRDRSQDNSYLITMRGNIQLQIKGLDVDVTDTIWDYVEDRLSSLGKVLRLDDPLVRISVELGRTTNHHKTDEAAYRAEVQVTAPGATYFAEAHSVDLYVAIDDVRDEIMRQVRDGKGKSRSMIRRGGAMIKKLLRLE